MVKRQEHLNILDLLDTNIISLNKLPWESITLPVFKYWCDLLLFENILYGIIMGINPSKKIRNVLDSVHLKYFRILAVSQRRTCRPPPSQK